MKLIKKKSKSITISGKRQLNVKQTKQSKQLKQIKQTKSKRSKKQKTKKISIKDTFNKVVDVIKKPFLQKTVDSENEKNANEHGTKQKNRSKSYVDVPFAESTSYSSCSKFFYITDIDNTNFDDWQLYKYILHYFPGISADEHSEVVKRNTIINMLNDVAFMQKLLKEYNINILDFFKFLFRLCPSVFKGLFVKKIQKTLNNKPYAQSIRFGKYSFIRPKSPSKKCSIF